MVYFNCMLSNSLEVESWRPQKSSFKRLLEGTSNLLAANFPPRWLEENLAFRFFSGLMTNIDLFKLNAKQREVLFQFFYETMYFNHYLDLGICRQRHGRQSLIFLEEWWGLPQRLAKLKEVGGWAGYQPAALASMDRWFSLNRILNFVSFELIRQQTLNWQKYQPPVEALIERKLLEGVKSAFGQWREKDLVDKAILFRAFSSVGYGWCLLGLTENKTPQLKELPLAKRLGAMVMLTQTLDDFWTPAKDKQYQILGMVKTFLETFPQQSHQVMALVRQIAGACLEEINFDPSHPWKRAFARWALFCLSGLAGLPMSQKYGGSHYPLSITRQAVKEFFSPPKAQSVRRESTKAALKLALENLAWASEGL